MMISLGIIFILSTIKDNNLEFRTDGINNRLKHNDGITLENEKLKISKVSGKIHIDNNWSAAKDAGICIGNGTYSEPYVIEDLIIDGGGRGSCILIENSDMYFKIENCTSYNSGTGIRLSHVTNSILINNNCSAYDSGISLYDSYHNTIVRNTLNYNNFVGISLILSDHTIISGNDVSNNYHGISLMGGDDGLGLELIKDNIITGNIVKNNEYGIRLYDGSNNSISNNTVNDNNVDGISLHTSYWNIVSGNVISNNIGNGISLSLCIYNTLLENTINYNYKGIYLSQSDSNNVSGNNLIGNSICWEEFECENNIFENNNCSKELIIQGYNLLFLICTFSFVIIIMTKKVKKLGKVI